MRSAQLTERRIRHTLVTLAIICATPGHDDSFRLILNDTLHPHTPPIVSGSYLPVARLKYCTVTIQSFVHTVYNLIYEVLSALS